MDCLLKGQMKAIGAKIAIFSLENLSGRLFKKAKNGSFYKVNGDNNKEVGSVESFNLQQRERRRHSELACFRPLDFTGY